jgi:hypothetical protein
LPCSDTIPVTVSPRLGQSQQRDEPDTDVGTGDGKARVKPIIELFDSGMCHPRRIHGPSMCWLLAVEVLAAPSSQQVYWTKVFVKGCKMTLETMIGSLSRDEKLAAMDLIWRDLAADSQSFVSPEWHATIIADRLKNPAPGQALPVAEARAEIKEAFHARRASR